MAGTSKESQSKIGVSRRSFIKGGGIAAVGVAALETAAHPAGAAAAGAKAIGPDAVPVTLKVNGVARTINIEPRTTLAEALRGPLDLTGTKISCDRGACSACTVLLDGAPVASCSILAIDVGPRAVTTVEGLAHGGVLHPVQEAFIEHDAMQCGYCTPGMVVSGAALLERNPHPTLDDVKDAVSGHFCRCGSYPHVFSALLAAAGKTR